jgi:hypothetical protein
VESTGLTVSINEEGEKPTRDLLARAGGQGQGWIWIRSGPGLGFVVPEGQREGRMECLRRRLANKPMPIEPLTK